MTRDEAIALAREVLANKPRSHVEAARLLAEYVYVHYDDDEPVMRWARDADRAARRHLKAHDDHDCNAMGWTEEEAASEGALQAVLDRSCVLDSEG